jgi:hypothetical protein
MGFKDYLLKMDKETYEKKALQDHMPDYIGTIQLPEMPDEDDIPTVTYAELLAAKPTATAKPDIFWDGQRYIKGPDSIDDEDAEETTIRGKTYMVTDTTKRVYVAKDNEDVFIGYIGIGEFA